MSALPRAVQAFDALAPRFDERFRPWRSVAAQRAAVRRELLRAFPERSSLLELGGGTGEDAVYLAERGRNVLLTDGSPAMVACAARKAEDAGLSDRIATRELALEDLERFAGERSREGLPPFDGAYSNFAALNCVDDLGAVGRGLARLVRAGGRAQLVVFGPFSPGEILTLLLRGKPRAAFRRFSAGPAPARVGGVEFTVRYPSPGRIARAFGPAFRLRRVVGIGILVPPSSAEPEISAFPGLLSALEAADRLLSRPLALLGDHVLLDLERTEVTW